ncbi:hypothetical protein U6B65_06555 [Oscillospiraceae bacterium MB08-C2-2]|nr:hypothetical protein U6B65_06555 [Oscillospiraceae bacterium MB08-C2-2]
MRLFLTSFFQCCKRLFRQRAFWAILILLPLAVLAWGRLTAKEPAAVLRAGVLFNPAEATFGRIFESLPQNPSLLFEAYTPQQRSLMEQRVKTGQLECAYLLEDALIEAIEQGRLQEAVTLLRRPSSIAEPVFNEMLFAAVLEQASPAIVTRQLAGFYGDDPAVLGGQVKERLQWYTEQALYLSPKEQSVAAAALPVPPSNLPRTVHGLILWFLTGLILFSLPRFIQENERPLWRRLGYRGLIPYYGGLWLALTGTALLAGGIGLGTLSLIYPSGLLPAAQEFVMLLLFCSVLAILGILWLSLLHKTDALYSGSIFILILTGIFGGVFFSWQEISPRIAAFCRFFPTELYMDGLLYDSRFARAVLAGISAAAGLATLLRLRVWFLKSR